MQILALSVSNWKCDGPENKTVNSINLSETASTKPFSPLNTLTTIEEAYSQQHRDPTSGGIATGIELFERRTQEHCNVIRPSTPL